MVHCYDVEYAFTYGTEWIKYPIRLFGFLHGV